MTDRPGASGAALDWDSLGRLARVRATPGGTILATYTYDALDRLVFADRGAAGRLRFRYAGTTPALTGMAVEKSPFVWTPGPLLCALADQRACPAAYLSTPRASGSPPRSSRATA